MSYNNYAINILGKQRWNELINEYNLNTKKWTYGRTKDFYKQVEKEIKEKLSAKENEKKLNIIQRIFKKLMKRR